MSQVIPLGPAARMLTTREAALRLGVSLRTVQLWVEASILPAARTPGGHRRIPYNAVEALALNMGLEPPSGGGSARASEAHARARDGVVRHLPDQGMVPRAANAPRAVRAMRIVLVSHDEPWLNASASALEVFGPTVSVCTADNGYVGLLQIGREPPDLLVTTLELPGMDGFQMLRTLERAESLGDMRVLALTAQPPDEQALHGGLPDRVELLPLPMSPEALAIRVGRWLLTRQSSQGAHHE
jgi:excisionase family DNA binding protein